MLDKITSWVLGGYRVTAMDTEELTALELIGKVTAKTNEVVDTVNNVTKTIDSTIANKIDEMVANGDIEAILDEALFEGVSNKLKRVVNLKNSTDIQTAINNNDGCIFDFNGLSIELNIPLIFSGKTNIEVRGYGKIKLKNQALNQKILVFYDCKNVKVSGLEIDGNRANQDNRNYLNSWEVSENCPAILIENCHDMIVKDCNIYNVIGDGIQVDIMLYGQLNTLNRESKNIVLYNNKITTVGRNGISLVHCDGVIVKDNTIKNVDMYTTTLAAGVDIEPNGGYGFMANNIVVHDNTFILCKSGGVHILNPNNLSTIKNIVISDNRMERCGVGHITLQCKTVGQNFIYKDNKILDCTIGISFDDSSHLNFINEVILNAKKTGASSGFGITANTNFPSAVSTNIIIKDAVINDCDDNGMYLSNVSNSEISVTIKNDSKVSGEKASIRFLNNCDNVTLINCLTNTNGVFPIYFTNMGGFIRKVKIVNSAFMNNAEIGVVSSSIELETVGVYNSIASEKWIAPQLTNGWANAGGTFSVAGYQKGNNDVVRLSGILQNGTVGQPIFVLPVGYRPSKTIYLPIVNQDSSLNSFIRIENNGNVIPVVANGWVALDGVSFKI